MSTRDALIYLGTGYLLGAATLHVGLHARFRVGQHIARRRPAGPPPKARGVATPDPSPTAPSQAKPRPAAPAAPGGGQPVPPWFAAETAVQLPTVRATNNQHRSLR